MPQLTTPYLCIKNALSVNDLEYLKASCKQHLFKEGIPCFVLIERLETPTVERIKQTIERHLNDPVYYLNDFFMYTDTSFKTSWHIDTELFSFESAVNAWILLSPDSVESPLAIINRVNEQSDTMFHDVRISGSDCKFSNYCTGDSLTIPLKKIEAERIRTPCMSTGDILLFNPKLFHKTEVDVPKHAIILKFVLKATNGFLARSQVHPKLWPEVGMFNKFVKTSRSWSDVLACIRAALNEAEGRKALSAGFYPEKFPLYKRMVTSL